MKRYYLSTVALSLALAGCGGGGGGSSDSSDSSDGGGSTDATPTPAVESTPTPVPTSDEISFNLKNASVLIASEDLVQDSRSVSRRSASGKELFSYQVVNGINNRDDSELEGTQTNLLAIDEDGNATLALESEYPVKVMYSVTNPETGKVYIALDPYGYTAGAEYVDYTQAITRNNCALFEVDPEDNTSTCVAEGKYLADYNDEYMQTISGNQKPIQFDDAGNVYFLATSFTIEDSGEYCLEYDEDFNCIKNEVNLWLNSGQWQPTLYKHIPASEDVAASTESVSQDIENIQFFLVLSSGELVYQSWNEVNGNNTLWMYKGDSVIDLTGNSWGVDFFTTDSSNVVLYGENSWNSSGEDGIRIAQPGTVGAKKTSLNTSLFATRTLNSYANPKPQRIIVADDGNVYGVFTSTKYNEDYSASEEVLKVYQMLPYNPIPKAVLNLGTDNWWSWMGNTPFQISKGYLYYVEQLDNVTVEGESLGSADYIQMINLNTLDKTTLLEPVSSEDARYEMYTWRLSGTELHFSALNKNGNTVKTGVIDTLKVRDDEPMSEFLSIVDSASALGSVTKVKDIEVIKPVQPADDPGNAPLVSEVTMKSENPYSISVEFSKYMDKATVVGNLNIQSSDAAEQVINDGESVPYMPIWIYKTLHMVPDLSAETFGDSVVEPLSPGKTYTLEFKEGIRDAYAFDLVSVVTDTYKEAYAPESGWYVGDTSAIDATVSDGKVVKFAGRTDTSTYAEEDYVLASLNGTDNPNIRIEFSAKNFDNGLGYIALKPENSIYETIKVEFRQDQLFVYANNSSIYEYTNNSLIADGSWAKYRIDIYGTNLVVSINDNDEWIELASYDTVTARATSNYDLVFGASEKVSLDNLMVTSLETDGTFTTEADLVNEDFNSLTTFVDIVGTEFNLEAIRTILTP